MKKEVILAVLLGLSLGLIVTYGIYRARRAFIHSPLVSVSPTPTTPDASVYNSLTLASPEDETIQSTKEIKITGTTKARSIIVALVNTKEHITTADDSGNFSISADLDLGSNVITVRAIDEDGNVAEQQRTVIFFTGSLDEAPTASSSGTTATSSAKPKTTTTRTATSSATKK